MKCFCKVKNFLRKNKVAFATSAVSSALSVASLSCFAADAADSASIQTALTTGFQSCVNDIVNYAVAVVPIALTAFGVTFAITKAVQFFKKVTGK